jgi:hypothetical protein
VKEEHPDSKNNFGLKTEWTETTWKVFEGTIRRGRNMSIRAYLLADDDDDDDGNLINLSAPH